VTKRLALDARPRTMAHVLARSDEREAAAAAVAAFRIVDAATGRPYILRDYPSKRLALDELRDLLSPYPPGHEWRLRLRVAPAAGDLVDASGQLRGRSGASLGGSRSWTTRRAKKNAAGPALCTVEGCGGPVRWAGLCSPHYDTDRAEKRRVLERARRKPR